MINIDLTKSIVTTPDEIIFVLKFVFTAPIKPSDFGKLAKDILYEEQGSGCCLRMAPKELSHLNANFVEGAGDEACYSEFYGREDNEMVLAFFIRETDPDVTLTEELAVLSDELSEFCKRISASLEQLDIAEMYKQ